MDMKLNYYRNYKYLITKLEAIHVLVHVGRKYSSQFYMHVHVHIHVAKILAR